ncbi:hypothetical protein [Nostoc sp.]|uniref:hypothetical protein n=1 Tax=Nostoc sp. TaxID=1180 RepID=UPI002FF942F3
MQQSTVILTLVMVLIATTVAAVIVIQLRDIAYTGVTLWALVAMAAPTSATNALKHSGNSILKNTVFVLAIILVLTATINSLRTRKEHI